MNIPKIRFKQNNGENFPDWAQVKIYSLGEFIRGQTYSRDQVTLDPSATFIVRSSNLIDGWFVDFCKDKQLANVEVSDNELLKSGDVVICTANGSTSLVGKASIYDGRYSGSISWGAFCSVFRSNQEAPLAKYFFRTPRYRKLITSMKQGGNGALGNLNVKEITNVSIPFPCAEEQQKIASFFSTLDQKIELNERKVEALEKLKKGIVQKIFTQEIRFRDKNGNQFPNWCSKKLLYVAPLQRGFDLPNSNLVPGSFPVVYSNGINFSHNSYKCEGEAVITGRSGTIGRVTYLPNCRYWPHNTTLWVTNFFNNIPKFIYYLYQYIDLHRFSTGTGVPTLNRNIIHDFVVTIPIRDEQLKISQFLTTIDTKINTAKLRLERLQELKKGFMQQMFV